MACPFRRSLTVVVAILAFSTACDGGDDLSVTEAEAGLRSSPTFTERPGSAVGRELVDIVAIRRIGRKSTEVEFTWRDAGSAGPPAAGPRTSMALFRQRDDGVWVLNSLYKVN